MARAYERRHNYNTDGVLVVLRVPGITWYSEVLEIRLLEYAT